MFPLTYIPFATLTTLQVRCTSLPSLRYVLISTLLNQYLKINFQMLYCVALHKSCSRCKHDWGDIPDPPATRPLLCSYYQILSNCVRLSRNSLIIFFNLYLILNFKIFLENLRTFNGKFYLYISRTNLFTNPPKN